MHQKKVLVLGATGAMGKYLVPKLAACNYAVDAVSLEEYDFGCQVNLIKAQAKDFDFRTKLLENKYDGIIDFLTYPTEELVLFLPELLESTDHYIYLHILLAFAKGKWRKVHFIGCTTVEPTFVLQELIGNPRCCRATYYEHNMFLPGSPAIPKMFKGCYEA